MRSDWLRGLSAHLDWLVTQSRDNVVAIVDPDENQQARVKKWMEGKGLDPAKLQTFTDYRVTCQRAVQFLSPTAPGSQSDKRLAKPLERVEIPLRSVVLSDLGFQGLNLTNKSLIHPAKKPKGRELNPAFRPFNRAIAAVRVGVEHVISGVKLCRIVSDILRHIKEGFNDLVMEVACGLRNFREVHRSEVTPVLLPIQMN